jgi:23S rRNA U2552 (ribose-2'-O)-methylase RlmE/FtsJ
MNKKRVKQHLEHIKKVYIKTDETYMNTYEDKKDKYVFLNEYDNMNIYSMYPEMTIIGIENDNKKDAKSNLDMDGTSDYKRFKYRINKMDNMYIKVKNKYLEYEKEDKSGFSEYQKLKKKYKGEKINYYFHYHVIDRVRALLKNDKISNAWLKSYEIYTTFDLIDSFEEKEFNTFHLCELPGQFILSLQHYIKKRTKKKLNWIAQSLNPYNLTNRRTMQGKFLPDQYNMAKDNEKNYDFGDTGTGDITDIDNIKYYHKKYAKSRHLVTSDCGQDSSADFSTQEKKLSKVYWGQFVCAIGLLKKGGNFFMKMFSVHTVKMIELVYMCSLLFENVYICKPLKTTFMSGETYMVCKNFLDIDTDKYINKLYTYIEDFDRKNIVNLDIISEKFIYDLNKCNNIMCMRRLVNFNILIYLTNNFKYYVETKGIKEHIDNIVNYYVKYYIDYYRLE